MSRTCERCSACVFYTIIIVNIVLTALITGRGTGKPDSPWFFAVLALWVWMVLAVPIICRIGFPQLAKATMNTSPPTDSGNDPIDVPTSPSDTNTPHDRHSVILTNGGNTQTHRGGRDAETDKHLLVHRSRRRFRIWVLVAGHLPALALFILYSLRMAASYYDDGLRLPFSDNCTIITREGQSLSCGILRINLVVGIASVVWTFMDVTIRSKAEWERWKKTVLRVEEEVEMPRVRTVEPIV